MNLPDPRSSNPAPTEPDRRQHPRYTVQVQIELRQEGSDVPMRLETTDLSRGGCYIQLISPSHSASACRPPSGSAATPSSSKGASSPAIPNSATASCSWSSKVKEISF